jgi:hypothetical protein
MPRGPEEVPACVGLRADRMGNYQLGLTGGAGGCRITDRGTGAYCENVRRFHAL